MCLNVIDIQQKKYFKYNLYHKAKYFQSLNPEQFFCSKCALNLALKGQQIEEILSEEGNTENF
jgi:hypothetical protein